MIFPEMRPELGFLTTLRGDLTCQQYFDPIPLRCLLGILGILETLNILPFFPSRLPCYQVHVRMCHEKLYAIHIVFLNCQPEFLNYNGEIGPKWVITFGRSHWPKVNASELYLAWSLQGYPPGLIWLKKRSWYWIWCYWPYGYPW